ncbi:MAG: hypothetical protein Dasosvirus23_3 [Dasosvirus sp.]|uniref:Uncharacterized protein n=1 Tax=Dasosvirus sp. TaxID=2487764 RepID=A0A3G4ZTL4_9VIRU|nr:MAG: hypothetical protein Dasosvirus23_3 [Dasosvirus sp.]
MQHLCKKYWKDGKNIRMLQNQSMFSLRTMCWL